MLCHQLDALRTKANLSYKQLASLCNLSETTITRICSGETADPNFSTVSSIVAACGGSLDEIAGIQKNDTVTYDNKHEYDLMVGKYETRIENTKKSYEQRIIQLNESHDRQVEQLESSHNRQIDLLTESNERRIRELNESFERRITELNGSFERRTVEGNLRFYSVLVLLVVAVVFILYLFLDAMHGNWGIFRYQEMIAAINPSSAVNGGAGLMLKL